jgi:DNA-binding transcriptional LysR family regulator
MSPYTRSPKIVEEFDSFASLIAAVEAGRGVAFLVQVMSLLAGKRLVLRPLKPAPPRLPVAVAYRPDGLSAAAAAFLAATIAARPRQPRSSRPILTA